jgi:putative transposase
MNKDYIHKARGVSNLKCHLVLRTKYRRQVLTDAMLTRLSEIFKALMEKWEGKLIEFNGERDHVWTNGYFIASCGGVTVEQLKKYINEQDRPIND